MSGRLSIAQYDLLTKVRAYQRRYGPGPTLTMVGRTMVNGTPLEAMLPKLIADGWLVCELIGNMEGRSVRLVAHR